MNKADLLNQLCKLIQDNTATPGEKAAAEAAKARIMEKYDLTEADIEQATDTWQDFRFKNRYEERLLTQITFHVVEAPKFYDTFRNNRKVRNLTRIRARQDELIKIEFLYEFYRAVFEREIDKLYEAFIYKHDLYPIKVPENAKSPERTKEEIAKIAMMANGLDDKTPHLQITDGKQ